MPNKTLFSKHYLENRIQALPEWSEDILPIFEHVRKLWVKARELGETWNEAQTEDELVKPIFELLGWHFIVQTKSKRGGQVTRPDYALFDSENNKDSAYKYQGDDDAFYSRSLAIGEAKYWGRQLSEKDSGGRDTWKTGENPSHQMVSYLIGTKCEWGILTNGIIWRLYSREVSSVASQYYEVDLGRVFDFLSKDATPSEIQIEQFKLWWLFFRKSGFVLDNTGKSFVRRVLGESDIYAREISEKLKELVYKNVMPEIAGGFIAFRYHEKGIKNESLADLDEIYTASLSLLYKILFLLYAEARDLLPVGQDAYRRESITEISRRIAKQIDENRVFSNVTYATPIYDRLLGLFRRIDRGDINLNIPRYNGGLFSSKSQENKFLESHKLNDRAIAQAIDLLVRDDGQPVDYAYISVRNLGAIYEGLLENKLDVIDAANGKVELINDKGERKATGSYYTPDYIVEYIVENSLLPVLDSKQVDFEDAMLKITDIRNKLKKTTNSTTNHRMRNELENVERQALEAFLGIKVLDPAMGSGHFLVNAVDFLTDQIITRLQAFHSQNPKVPWDWNPIQNLLEKVRKDILVEMKSQGISIDTQRLDDTGLLTRLVMKRCIYGVDINPMAVELAKLSLWLHSFTIGAPLSFLDHHLRWGNSLIGTDVRTVEYNITTKRQDHRISKQAKKRATARGERVREVDTAFQSSLFSGPFPGLLDLTSMMIEVAEKADATLADVYESAQAFDGFQKALIPYKQALNLWISQFYGKRDAKDFMELYGNDVLPAIKGELQVSPEYREAIIFSDNLWKQKRFFNWDLEFPEVFIDIHQRSWSNKPGFDAIIGNPPYVDVQSDNFFNNYYECAQSRNLYSYMIEKSINILKQGQRLGLIVPLSLVCSERMDSVRRLIQKTCKSIDTANFGIRPSKIFPNVDQRVTIIFAEREDSSQEPIIRSTFLKHWHPGEEFEMIENLKFQTISGTPKELGWAKLGDKTSLAILKKITQKETKMGDFSGSDYRFYYHGIGRYWLKAYDFIPTYVKQDGKPGQSSTLFEMGSENDSIRKLMLAIINSSLFYWYWTLYSDDFHLMQREILSFPFEYDKKLSLIYKKISVETDLLMTDIKKNSILKRGKYSTGTITWQEFYPRQSKNIIDRIDDLLGIIYGLTPTEVEYIKSYMIEFRTDSDDD